MKGVVLAGGLGTRLRPLTSVMNKHLLPVYDRPMIYYPLEMLAEAGIDEVMVVVGGQSTEQIMKLCGNGSFWGFKTLYYAYQATEGGIADALALTEKFVSHDSVCVVLGDNLMLGDKLSTYVDEYRFQIRYGALVLLAEVVDPQNYGVPTFSEERRMGQKRILEIIEKPKEPSCNFGVVGVYIYDGGVFSRIRNCAPSARNELEITDVNNLYAKENKLNYRHVKGHWVDCGSSLKAYLEAGALVEEFFTGTVQAEIEKAVSNKG